MTAFIAARARSKSGHPSLMKSFQLRRFLRNAWPYTRLVGHLLCRRSIFWKLDIHSRAATVQGAFRLVQPYRTVHRLDKLLRVVSDAILEDQLHLFDVCNLLAGISFDHHQVGQLASYERTHAATFP